MLQGVDEVTPSTPQCEKCKEKNAARLLVIGANSARLCDGCYVEVWNMVRPLNRRGRRTALRELKAENRKNGIPNRVHIVALLDTPEKEEEHEGTH